MPRKIVLYIATSLDGYIATKDDCLEWLFKTEGDGELLHDFIEQRLVDEWIITIAPTIIGDGIPLFKNLDFETRLVLKGVRRFNQFTELHYESR